jgi:maltose O-acetyltransferase
MNDRRRDARILGGWLVEDARDALRHVVRHSVAGSPLLPRLSRYAIYRAAGIHTATANLCPHLTITGPGRNLSIGARTFVNRDCHVDLLAPVSIGSDCLLAMDVLITTSDHERGADGVRSRQIGRPITVGNRVWLGARSTLLPGVSVGDDVIVAAGAVVTRDCAPAGLYAGVPARRIKDLPTALSPDRVSASS